MKKIFLSVSIFCLLVLGSITAVLSTIGYETNKFNEIISKKISENNQNITLKFEKIKFKFDVRNLSLFLDTQDPQLSYKNLEVPLDNIKLYVDFISLIGSKVKIEKINIKSKEITSDKLKDILIKTKPSNLNSFINNRVKNGKLITDIEIYFDNNLKIKNFIAKGEVNEMQADVNKKIILHNTSFNFFADNSDILVKNIKSKINGAELKNGSLQIERDETIKIKSDFTTDIDVNKKNNVNISKLFEKIEYINKHTVLKAQLNHTLNLTFDKTFKVIDYSYKNNGKIKEVILQADKPIKNILFEQDIKNLNIKDSIFELAYNSQKKNFIYSKGIYQLNNFDYQKYDFKNYFSKGISNIETEIEFKKKFTLGLINYKKDKNKLAKISSSFKLSKGTIFFKELRYIENKNLISLENLRINKNYLISLKKINVKTYEEDNLKNDFTLNFDEKITMSGKKFDATNINKFLNKKNDENNFLKKISKSIEIDLKNIETPLSKKLTNFKLIGDIKKGKFVKILSKGDFGNNQFLDISLKSNKNNKKRYLEIYSDIPQTLLSDFSFFKGLSDGTLTFSSILEEEISNSKLIIENFKIVNAPGVVKLLSLADFGGLADLAEGEGLSFEKLEIKLSKDKNATKIEELYAVGPSISVLMDGYQEDKSGLTSLRGTLVPAKNLNKLISKIPVIGNIIIPKEIGEGLFGVSFKMKGLPGKIKTTINPIKTLTPRFITKALEKTKRSK